jgi:hypothetical protein
MVNSLQAKRVARLQIRFQSARTSGLYAPFPSASALFSAANAPFSAANAPFSLHPSAHSVDTVTCDFVTLSTSDMCAPLPAI